ncbi:hypothetical protein IKS57_03490 [bacterium]|nr:hypothetical protein [bacterium]
MAIKGQENLIPMSERSKEEVREIARKGGINSGIVRKEKATMKATLEMLLNTPTKKGITYKEMATLGLIKGAIKGNAQNYKTILEVLGELNSDSSNAQDINNMITNIANLINNPVNNRTEDNIDKKE